MKNQKLLEILKNIGLDESEAQVYLSALSLGPTTILKISKASELKRTTVYGIVEDLKQKGLMSIELKGLKQLYRAESPEKLEMILESKQREFTAHLPEFLALHKIQGRESTIKIYTGLKTMKQIYTDTLKEIKSNEDYLVITHQEKWFHLDPDFWMKHYIEPRAKLNIKTRLLFQDSDIAREHKKFEKNFNETIKILPEGTHLNVDTILLPQKLIIVELLPPYNITIIENQNIIELHCEMFNLLWDKINLGSRTS